MALPASYINAASALALFGANETDINNELDVIYQAITTAAETGTSYTHTLVDASSGIKQGVLAQLSTDGYAVTVLSDGKLFIDWSGIIP